MLEKGIDTIVLGCTHYPFVFPVIREIIGEDVRLIDPSPAIAKQVKRILEAQDLRSTNQMTGKIKFLTTGDKNRLADFLKIAGIEQAVSEVKWGEDI